MELYKMFIDGQWCEASNGATREQINPSNGESLGFTAEGTVDDVNRAVDAAAEAFKIWRLTTPAQRAELLRKAADLVDERAEEIARLESGCTGQLLGGCRGDAGTVSAMFRFYAGLSVCNGLSEDEVWKMVTVNPAEILGIAHRVGTIEVGKDADIVLYPGDPLREVGVYARITIINGQIVYSAKEEQYGTI